MAEWRVLPDALKAADFERLREAVLASVFVARSTLNGPFEASRGFGVAFKAEGRAQVLEKFPQLAPFFAKAIDEGGERRLLPFWRRRQALPAPNAWYLNLLLVGTRGGVTAHVDATLAGPSGVDVTPRVVSVLYLRVPPCPGGELVLAREKVFAGVVTPREGALVHFRGDLEHQVRALEDPAEGALRASLVLEQYHFDEAALSKLPTFRLDSLAKFELALAKAATHPTRFDLEE